MTGDRSRLMNFMKKFIGKVRFGNDHFGAIIGYGDYVVSDSVISRVYYVEGLGNNLFSVGQFCDSNLEVAFRKHSCYVRDTDGVELLKGSHGSNLYTSSVEEMMKSSPICLLSKASKHKSWKNPDDVAESQPLPTPSVLAGPNLEHSDMIPEEPVSSTGTLYSLQHVTKDFSYGDQFIDDKPSEANNEKTTADIEAESMVSVTIKQDTSVIPPMMLPMIGLVPRPDSPNVRWPLPTTTTTTSVTTTTTTLPLPP
ncbi:hypothetical protein Tco_1129651 [Tanacetum coccineum]